MRDILKTIFVIIGTMIGAGFASGQEIYLFFNRYGTMGILGLIISCTLAGIIIYKVFQIVKNKKIHTYSEFLENISNCPYIDNAGKPNPENYCKAVKEMNLEKSEVVYIGDQIFTDILGANNAGIANILVKFIGYKTEKKIGIKRHIEKIILKLYSFRVW